MGRTISQKAFDEVVKENMEDLGMDPAEALQDAIETLSLQGVDLSGIVTCIPGQNSVADHPVLRTLERLKKFDSDSSRFDGGELEEFVALLDELSELFADGSSGNVAIATRNGGLTLMASLCHRVSRCGNDRAIISLLKAVSPLLIDNQNAEAFQKSGGPDTIMAILNGATQSVDVLNGCFSVIAASSTGDEILKESFMNLKIEVCINHIIKSYKTAHIPCMFDAIRTLLTSDDNRVVASQVYGYARKFAETGIAEALVDLLHEGISSPSLVSATVALRAVAVNDEICRSVADSGGIDAILRCIDDSGDQMNKIVAQACCSLLCKLAGSDANKSAIMERNGMSRLIRLCNRFSDDTSVLQEVMSIITVLTLRSPDNAARAVEAGAGDLAIQAMQRFPDVLQVQRNACFMIRNLVARNQENRVILLNNGIEKIIRKAKETHGGCKAAATDALRDLGLNNYNYNS